MDKIKLDKIHRDASEEFLKYGVLIELMLSKYSGSKPLSDFSPALLSKHKNLLSEWKRVNKQHFDHVEKNYPELLSEYYAQIEYWERIFDLDWTEVHFEKTNNRLRNGDTKSMGSDRDRGVQGSGDGSETDRPDK